MSTRLGSLVYGGGGERRGRTGDHQLCEGERDRYQGERSTSISSNLLLLPLTTFAFACRHLMTSSYNHSTSIPPLSSHHHAIVRADHQVSER